MSKVRLLLLALIVVAVPVSFLVRRAVDGEDDTTPLLRGAEAPAFALPRLDGDGQVSSADLAGKPYLLVFWGSWCGECELLLSILARYEDTYTDVTFLGVVVQDTVGAARKLAAKTKADWPMLLDDDGKVARSFGTKGAPVTFFVGKDGKVSGTLVGPYSRPLLEQQVRRMT